MRIGTRATLIALLCGLSFVLWADGAPWAASALPAPPAGLPQTWLASFHLNGHVFSSGQRITATVQVLADNCFGRTPCISGAEWSGMEGRVVAGCKPTVPLGTPTLTCTWIAEQTDGWVVAGANFINPTGTPAVSQDFYLVTSKPVLDGQITYRQTGHPVPNVHVSIKGATRFTATTDADGYYAQVVARGRYTVVPEGGGHNQFHPTSRHVFVRDKQTADFTLDENPIGVSYRMPDRLTDANKDGLIDYSYDSGFVNPSSWPVDLTLKSGGKACDTTLTYAFVLEHQPLNATAGAKPCEFVIQAPKLGKFLLEVTGRAASGEESYGKDTVTIRDFFVVGLGDSVGSGEGDPDVPGTVKLKTPTSTIGDLGTVPILVPYPTGGNGVLWEDSRCDRSAGSFEAVAARGIEDGDPQTSVTFVHLACSGAGISAGEVGPYFGIAPGGNDLPLPSQVSQLQSIAGSRTIDAVIVSIGANDVGFGDIVLFCIEHTDCQNQAFNAAGQTLATVTKAKLAALPAAYAQLASRLRSAGVAADRVYITQYFDPLRGSDGTFCDRIVGASAGPLDLGISADEAAWSYNAVVRPLNAAVAAAAAKHRWNLIGGIAQGFRTHGYCASPSWIVSIGQSLAQQGNQNGTMHPNLAGHRFTGGLVEAALKKDLYPGGTARLP